MNNKNYLNIIAAFEQAGSLMGQFAYLLGCYREKLEKNGFTRSESLELCKNYQQLILEFAFNNKNNQNHFDNPENLD